VETNPSLLSRRWHLPFAAGARRAIRALSPTERSVFWTAAAVFAVSGLLLLWQVNRAFMVTVPDKGGELSEGVVGSPRFVNPLLATSDADRDLVALVYAGLMKADGNGNLIGELAESYTVSEDGKEYVFTLKPHAVFHDGSPVTAGDVVFTVDAAKDAVLKSPRRANWEGVTAEEVDSRTVRFTLRQPYSSFLENATLGILPKRLWATVAADEFPFSDLNVNPVGAGPYRVDSVGRTAAGIPSEYRLRSFRSYVFGEPFITRITLSFFPNERMLLAALEEGQVKSAGSLTPALAVNLGVPGTRIESVVLPRVFGIFFNQNQNRIFATESVRKALDAAVGKDRIVTEVLSGYGAVASGPLPPQEALPVAGTETDEARNERIARARGILEADGWKLGEDGVYVRALNRETERLSFSIATGDAPELKKSAELAARDFADLGAEVNVSVYALADLTQNVIRPRKYDALLFGEIIGSEADLYPFWHSSQRLDPGLNVALYVNTRADRLLEEARAAPTRDLRDAKNAEFVAEIMKETPAVFLYSPSFVYAIPETVAGISLTEIGAPDDRFAEVHRWYKDTNSVWRLFANESTE
jgi:peptide/nickel transport system substrate-binding protein